MSDLNKNSDLSKRSIKVLHDYIYQGDVTAFVTGAWYAYSLISKAYNGVDQNPSADDLEQIMKQANQYADEDEIPEDNMTRWNLLLNGK